MAWVEPKIFLQLWLSLMVACRIVTATDLEFLSEPASRLVKASDQRAVFRCEVSPSSADVRWLWKGQPVVPNRWIRVSKHKLTVHLNKMDKSSRSSSHNNENGSFQCEAKLRGKVLVSAPAELIIAVLEPFPPQSDVHITAIKGTTAVIPCRPPHSVPTVVTEFLFNNTTTIKKSNDKHLLMSSGNLQIFDVQSEDSGEYICIANNPYLAEKCQAHHKIFLHVTEATKPFAPRFVVSPHSRTVTVLGSNISIECAVTGYPVPSITWKKHHGHLPHARHQQFAGNLMLFGVRREDEGSYYCEAENSVGDRISKATLLEVHETPQIVKSPRDVFTESGHNLSLQCIAQGHPRPAITWLHNGKTVTSENGRNTKDSEMVLWNVSHKQSGIYQCFASNELGSVYSSSVVIVSHHNKSLNIDYENEDYNDYGADDDEGSLNSQKLDHRKETYVSHVTSHNSGDLPTLNGGDLSRKKHRKKKKHKGVKLVPPSRPDVTRLSDTSVMVRWGVPRNDGLPILFFKVQYREAGKKGTQWMTIDEDIAAHIHSYAVTDLKNGGKYRFRIAAVYSNNDNKLGPNSAKFALYKDPLMKKPISGPIITHAEAVSPSAITLFWEYADLDLIPIEGFFIYYRATHSAGDYLKVTVLGSTTRSHIISHLLPDTSYDIKTQGFNTAGTSEFSNIFTCKTKPSENIGMRSRNSKSHQSDDETSSMSVTEPVSSKDSEGNILNIVLGIICSAVLIAITVFVVLYIRQKTNRQQHHSNDDDDEQDQETPIKMGNGHSNGYIPVNQINISVNPLSDFDPENEGKTTQNGSVSSNNNEIIQLQTFTSAEPQVEPLLAGTEKESTAGAEGVQDSVILPGNSDASAGVPRSI